MIRVARLVRARFAPTPAQAFSGVGAALNGQRWNSPGVSAAYGASTVSLAVLETLVHVDRRFAPKDYHLAYADLPEKYVEYLTALPAGWRTLEGLSRTRAVGDAFLRARRVLALAVPSAVVPSEPNFLINPAHPDFAALQIEPGLEPFFFDERLFAI